MVDKKRNVEDWVRLAKEIGFSHAGPLDPKTLKTENWVRETCSSDKCHAYGHNWTCPPACGTLEECGGRWNNMSMESCFRQWAFYPGL